MERDLVGGVEQSDVDARECGVGDLLDDEFVVAEGYAAPGAALGGNYAEGVERELTLGQDPKHLGPDRSGCADNGEFRGHANRIPVPT